MPQIRGQKTPEARLQGLQGHFEFISPLKTEAECKLDLALGTQPDRLFDGAAHDPEAPRGSGRERLSGLQQICSHAKLVRQHSRRAREVRQIEDVEKLRPEIDTGRFGNPELLVHDEIVLPVVRSSDRSAHQVAIGARPGC